MSGSVSYDLLGMPANEFPGWPELSPQAHAYAMASDSLEHMLRCVDYAQSTDETRYILNGVFLEFLEKELRLTATDGRRLATLSHPHKVSAPDFTAKLILPARAVQQLITR